MTLIGITKMCMTYLVIDDGFGCFLDVLSEVFDAHGIIGGGEVIYKVAALTTYVVAILSDSYF